MGLRQLAATEVHQGTAIRLILLSVNRTEADSLTLKVFLKFNHANKTQSKFNYRRMASDDSPFAILGGNSVMGNLEKDILRFKHHLNTPHFQLIHPPQMKQLHVSPVHDVLVWNETSLIGRWSQPDTVSTRSPPSRMMNIFKIQHMNWPPMRHYKQHWSSCPTFEHIPDYQEEKTIKQLNKKRRVNPIRRSSSRKRNTCAHQRSQLNFGWLQLTYWVS